MIDELRRKKTEIMRVAERYGAKDIRIFGSFARGEDTAESDADFLVNMEGSLLQRVALMQDLQELLGRKVDIVTERSIHWYVRDRIINEAVPL
jgi:predicted nucleotidyltransferase